MISLNVKMQRKGGVMKGFYQIALDDKVYNFTSKEAALDYTSSFDDMYELCDDDDATHDEMIDALLMGLEYVEFDDV